MKVAKWVLFGLAGALAIWGLLPLILSLFFNLWNSREAASVGIIGSADGPTAIFVATTSLSLYVLFRFIPAIVCAIAGFVLHRISKNKEK